MELYLLRHAVAVRRGTEGYSDDRRPLTKEGIGKMVLAAEGISKIVSGIDLIVTSPLIRASETAIIVADVLKCRDKIVECKELLPGVPVASLFMSLSKYKNKARLLLVGHEPELGEITASLLGLETPVIHFKKGAIARIDIPQMVGQGQGKLIWYFPPKLLRGFSQKQKA